MLEYVNEKIKKITNKDTMLCNIYSSEELVKFYNSVTTKEDFFNDVRFYKKNLKKSQNIIELASGSGRVLKELIDSDYNIIGVELEEKMIKSMNHTYKKFVVNEDIFNTQKLKDIYMCADVFILPATTISLFSLNKFQKLLTDLKQINNNFQIIFDFQDLNNLILTRPKKITNELGVFYYINYKDQDGIIYNVYHKDTNCLGISKKENHKLHDIIEELQKEKFDTEYIEISPGYYMIEVAYNGKK